MPLSNVKGAQSHCKRDLTALLREILTDIHFLCHVYRQSFSWKITNVTLVMSIAVYNVQTYIIRFVSLYIFPRDILKLLYNHALLYPIMHCTKLILCMYPIEILRWISLKSNVFTYSLNQVSNIILLLFCFNLYFYMHGFMRVICTLQLSRYIGGSIRIHSDVIKKNAI